MSSILGMGKWDLCWELKQVRPFFVEGHVGCLVGAEVSGIFVGEAGQRIADWLIMAEVSNCSPL